MNHRVAHRKLGRVTEHRIAMLRNQARALIDHERIETTVPRAKELRPFVERLITLAKRGIAEGGATTKALQARRLVLEDIPNRTTVGKLFDSIAPRFQGRPGGYVRILRVGYRRGDSAAVARIELVGSEYNPRAEQAAKEAEAPAPAPKGVGGRLRAAASRLRGRKAAESPVEKEDQPKPRTQRKPKAKSEE
jgi:large subunit ribosomal protein L17